MKSYELFVTQKTADVYPAYRKVYKYRGAAMRNFRRYADCGKYENVELFMADTDNHKLQLIATYTKPQEVTQ